MKATIIFALLFVQALALTPSCLETNYCQGCSDTTAGRCTACYSWGEGTVLARYRSTTTHNCLVKRAASLDTNCKMYANGATDDVKYYNTCAGCKKGYVLLRTYSAALSTSSMSTNWTSTVCTKKSSTYKEIDNCFEGSTTFVMVTGGTATSHCGLCAKGYKAGTTMDTNKAGYTTCASGAFVTNCETSMKTNTSGYQSTTAPTEYCYTCKSKYAVHHQVVSCVSYTTDENCRQLTSTSVCAHCWYSYYFNGTKCKLASSLMSFAAVIALALLSLY